ncbi:3,4-dihydroxy-2-butanone-4-phosphate synthase [Ichthyobacterium seriolicida]|uniref:3,4-dihydroxy-2-butanone 4-phosphate synthase n=1 Tax=Ichthyobacterium seriolicida TaxID=242600 RepID=A0A1J1E3Q6_9FLAO|nr:3,4-dihydroxy-2-butanone-4-phosphate synthase [Ichthyobacterium seriolicida]BAV94684.1 3,4-dihydroxy-2-butanone 4-phosphate synthase [Ichthyobacterium seriolicida]
MHKLDSIEEAIEDIKQGKIIIVVDDENRENEGDFVAAADMATPEMVNFMSKHGRGLICTPLLEERCAELDLHLMVGKNTDPKETAFTVSVDKAGDGCTTGISASDRSKTIKSLVDINTKSEDLIRPGHIFPLRAKKGGVLRRTGHTEAAVDLAKLAGLTPAGVLVEIMNDDGSMARLPDLFDIAKKFDLKIISIEDLVAYRMKHDSLIEQLDSFDISIKYGKFKLLVFQQTTNEKIHFAFIKGTWTEDETVLVKVYSAINNDFLTLIKSSDSDMSQIDRAFKKIEDQGKGVFIYINQTEDTISINNKINALKNDEIDLLKEDEKDFGIGAQIIHSIGLSKIKILTKKATKKTTKKVGLIGYGIEIVENVEY